MEYDQKYWNKMLNSNNCVDYYMKHKH